MTETLDHTESRQEGCACTLLSLCPECYARVEQERAEALWQGWAPKLRPRLRLVRREG
jgi:hypothetical protein